MIQASRISAPNNSIRRPCQQGNKVKPRIENYKYPSKIYYSVNKYIMCIFFTQEEGWKGAIPKTIIFRHNL